MAKTLFLSVSDIRELVTKIGFGPFYRSLSDRLEKDFRRWQEFQKAPRVANYSPGGVIELMPTEDSVRYSVKYVNGHPGNTALKLPTVMAFGCLAEVSTGFPLLLSEMTLLTAIRTAATSAVAAKALANPRMKRMAMIGNGAQSEFQVLAFHSLLGVEDFNLFDVDPSASRRLRSNLAGFSNIRCHIFDSTEAAIEGCKGITTATARKKHQQVLNPEIVSPGVHINAIGGDCPGKTELDSKLLESAKVFVEFAPQARIEGEIQQMSPDFHVVELWEVLTGRDPGRTSESDLTIFDSVGFSLEDFSVLSLVYEIAVEHSIGSSIELVPEMEDPRNLFSFCQTK